MVEKKQERISIFIDGSNLYYSLKDLEVFKIDFQKLVNLLKRERLLVSAFYYNAPLDIRAYPHRQALQVIIPQANCSIAK